MEVSGYTDKDGRATFRLLGGPPQAANALRRAITARVPTVAMVAFPPEACTITIATNTSQFNNEILKQRLACIPIHITDRGTDVGKYTIRVSATANGPEARPVTTADFEVVMTDTGTPLAPKARDAVFPANPLTGDHVLLARLRPATAGRDTAETLEFTATMVWTEGAQGGSAASASTCAYAATPDQERQPAAWAEAGKPGTYEDWVLGAGASIVTPNSFDFTLESVGVYTNRQLLETGASTVVQAFERLAEYLGESTAVKPAESTIPNCYDLTVIDDVYMTGPYVQLLIALEHCRGDAGERVSYVGFRKPHPHDATGVLRIALSSDEGPGGAVALAQAAARQAAQQFGALLS
jgi:hypothetical protein